MPPNTQDVGQIAKSILPNFSANILLYIIITVVVMGAIGFGFYMLMKKSKYNIDFVIFKDVNGHPTVIDRVKGMEFLLGKTGEKVHFVKKYNKYLPIGSLQMGIRTYWYYIDKAGHWHNFDVNSIDVMKREPQLDMQLQMDYARDGINKRLEDRHDKPGFWEKWGTVMVSVVVITVLIIFIWLIIKDSLANNQTSQKNVQDSQKLQLEINKQWAAVMVAMDNVCANNPQAAQSYLQTYINQTNQTS